MMEDGIIKYNCQWKKTSAIEHSELQNLIFWRDRAKALGYIGTYPNHIPYGNISIKVEKGFLISGSNTGHLDRANDEHFSLVHKWNIQQNKLWCKGPVKASSESLTHAIIYDSLPQVKAILHIHQAALWEKYYSLLASTAPEIAYGTPEMAWAVQKLVIQNNTQNLFLMQGHRDGLVSYGENLDDCFRAFEHL